jgi:adenosylcobinamide kinase / adenosylcobinamide-phosphate guanylyltransferase
MRTLVLGGARSGKSRFAEALAVQSGREVVYLATATAGDEEMRARIAHHRTGRPAHWITIEEPLALGAMVDRLSSPHRLVLIDCLTLWLSNLLFADGASYPEVGDIVLPARVEQEQASLAQALARCDSDVVLVSNEVGMGLTPMGALSRRFMDEQGRLNQAMAGLCERAVFVAAGLPLYLKGPPC